LEGKKTNKIIHVIFSKKKRERRRRRRKKKIETQILIHPGKRCLENG